MTVRSVSPASRMDQQRWREGDPLLPPMPRRRRAGMMEARSEHPPSTRRTARGRGDGEGSNRTKPAGSPPRHHGAPIARPRPSGAREQERELKNHHQNQNKSSFLWQQFDISRVFTGKSSPAHPAGRDLGARCSPPASGRRRHPAPRRVGSPAALG